MTTLESEDEPHEMTDEEIEEEVGYAMYMDDMVYKRGTGYDLLVALEKLCERFCADCPRNPDKTHAPCLGGDEECPHGLEDAWDAIWRTYTDEKEAQNG